MSGATEPPVKVIERLAQSAWMAVVARVAMLAAPAVITWVGTAGIDAAKSVSKDLADIKTSMALYGARLDNVEKKQNEMNGVITQQAVTNSEVQNMKNQLQDILRIVADTQKRSEGAAIPGVNVN